VQHADYLPALKAAERFEAAGVACLRRLVIFAAEAVRTGPGALEATRASALCEALGEPVPPGLAEVLDDR
jgi:hypothetical protein